MKNKQIIGLVVAGAVFIVTGVTSVLTNTLSANTMAEDVTTMLAGELEFDPPADDYIGVVNVVGTIQEQTQSSVLDTSSGYQHNTIQRWIILTILWTIQIIKGFCCMWILQAERSMSRKNFMTS